MSELENVICGRALRKIMVNEIMKIKKELRNYENEKNAIHCLKFFKTGRGEYGEGDQFLGITVPNARIVAKRYSSLSFDNLQILLQSSYHEERLLAVFILVNQFTKADEKTRKKIFYFYLKNRKGVNNWDLVDSSADKIVGAYLSDKTKGMLYKYAKSTNLWERRIAIVSTYYFIKENNFDDTIAIAEILLEDKQDLIHKAVGWMLREVGKRNIKVLENFLQTHCKNIPRTTLRYAIEKFPEKKRKEYLFNLN